VPDTQVNAILDMAEQCLTQALNANPNVPANICRRLDLQVAWDADLYTDLCCEGLAYVSFGDIVPSWTGFPEPAITNQANWGACSPPSWGVSFRMGVVRCVPVGTDSTMPTCTEWRDASTQQAHDAQALRAATCCLRQAIVAATDAAGPFWGMSAVIGQQGQLQLQGGCVERNAEITVQIPNCDCISLE
jgi:hypothetical protein